MNAIINVFFIQEILIRICIDKAVKNTKKNISLRNKYILIILVLRFCQLYLFIIFYTYY